jgi:hypothetical protein
MGLAFSARDNELVVRGARVTDDGDGAGVCPPPFPVPCRVVENPLAGEKSDYLRPGSVILFPKFVSGGGIGSCGSGNVLVNGVCLPRTEIEVGATCPTLFTTRDQSQLFFPCTEHESVRVRFRWVCPGTEQKPTCKTTGFDVLLSLDGNVVFTANGFGLADANQVQVPAAPCERGYLIGWVINEFGQPIKYDGLIGKAVIRNSGTAAAAYRGITIQAESTTTPGSLISLFNDPIGLKPPGLPFLGEPVPTDVGGSPHPYRLVTGQVTGDVTFDEPAPASGSGFGVNSSLILLTLDVRANAPNFPTFVDLDFWNGSEERLSSSVEFVCWGEFQLSTDIDPNLTQAFMGTRKGIVQSSEAIKIPTARISDFITEESGRVTLLGLVQTNERWCGGTNVHRRIL